jgi:hypothetical protein
MRIFGLVAIRLRVIGLLVLLLVVRLGWVVIMLLFVSAIGRVILLVLLLAIVLVVLRLILVVASLGMVRVTLSLRVVLVFTIIIVVVIVLSRIFLFVMIILVLVSVVVVLLIRRVLFFVIGLWIRLMIVGFLLLTSATIGESVTILDRSRRIGGSLTRSERAFVDVLEAIGLIFVIFLTEAVAPAVLLSKLDLVVRHHVVVHFTQHSRAHTRQRN